jgi:anti-sigma factor RsiW
MKDTVDLESCDQGEALVSWLYDETGTPEESQKFEKHLLTCAACRTEAAAFRNIRQSIVAWRHEALGSVVGTSQRQLVRREKSARAALREFFSLSPLWMKGAVACASILFCVLMAIAIMRVREKPPVQVVSAPAPTEDFDRRVEQRAKELVAEKRPLPTSIPATLDKNRVVKKRAERASLSSTEVASVWKKRRPLSQQEREKLADDLRVSPNADDDFSLPGDGTRRDR